MKNLIFLVVCLISLQKVMATTYYTVADGDWTANIWSSSCSTCAGGALPALSDGDILIIDDQATIASGTITTTASVTIYLRTDNSPNTSNAPAKLIFVTGGKLSLGSGSSITLQNHSASSPDPIIDGSGAGGSNTITVGGTEYWRASDGDRQGTGTLQPDGTLPIHLTHFTVKKTEDGVVVSWITFMEEAFDKFIIEHSSDGKNFVQIGTQPGVGRDITNIETEYIFEHHYPLIGNNYYRLKALDLDGSWETFRVVAIKVEGSYDVSVFPNPAHAGNITFKTNFQTCDDDRILITNLQGQILLSITPFAGFNSIIPNENLPSGSYLLVYKGAAISKACKFIVE